MKTKTKTSYDHSVALVPVPILHLWCWAKQKVRLRWWCRLLSIVPATDVAKLGISLRIAHCSNKMVRNVRDVLTLPEPPQITYL